MKNLETLDTILKASRTAYFILQRELKHYADQLDYCVNNEIINGDGNPNNSAKLLVDEIGNRNAEVIIATLVNAKAWDGRISPDNAAWAASCEEAFDEAAVSKLGFHTTIHAAHLNAVARAFQNL